MRILSAAVLVQSLSCLVLLSGVAVAQDGAPVARFNEAADLAEKGRVEEAIAVWTDIQEVLPASHRPIALVNLGLANLDLGRLPEAWHYFSLWKGLNLPEDPEVEAWFAQTEKELAAGHVKTTIRCSPPNARVTLPSQERTLPCPAVWWLKPGPLPIRVTADGFEEKSVTMIVPAGSPQCEVEYTLERLADEGAVALPSTAGGTPAGGTGSSDAGTTVIPGEGIAAEARPDQGSIPAWKWAVLGGGGALLAAAGALHYVAWDRGKALDGKYPDGTPENPAPKENQAEYDKAYNADVLPPLYSAYALYGVGAAAAVTGIVMMLTGGGPGASAPAEVVAVPVEGGMFVGVGVGF